MNKRKRSIITPELTTLLRTYPVKKRQKIVDRAFDCVFSCFAPNTWKVRFPHFARWSEYAKAHAIDPLTSATWTAGERLRFEAVLDAFALEEYERCEQNHNKPATYDAIFSGINAVMRDVFNLPALSSARLHTWKRSYRMKHQRPTEPATPIRAKHLVGLHDWATKQQGPEPLWQLFVFHAVVIMFLLAGRWDDFCHIDIKTTLANIRSARAAGVKKIKFALFGRKNRNYPTSVVLSDTWYGSINPVESFLYLVTTTQRSSNAIEHKPGTKQAGAWLVPFCRKRSLTKQRITVFRCEPATQRLCGYKLFLSMFQNAMRLAGFNEDHWTLHCARRGWTTTAYQTATLMREHLIQAHMQVGSAEVARMYNGEKVAQAAVAADTMATAAFASAAASSE